VREERRRKERYELRLAMQVWRTGSAGDPYKAVTINVNAAGVLFALISGSPVAFQPGVSLRFNIQLVDSPDGSRSLVEGTGRVVRVDPGWSQRIALTITTWRFLRQPTEIPPLRMIQYAC